MDDRQARDLSDESEADVDQADDVDEADAPQSAAPPAAKVVPVGGGGLPIYKPGQGYYTRMGTVAGAAALVLWGIWWMHEKLGVYNTLAGGIYIQNAPVVVVFFAAAVLLYWLVGRNRRTADFMIATEGEMKKVSWSSRREIIGSTKVVLGAVLLIALVLFVVDLGFQWIFSTIGVVRLPAAGK